MNKNDIHLEHYRGNEEFVKRVYDLIDLAQRRNRMIVTPFFSPDQIAIMEFICGNQIHYIKDGGYEGAERCRFAILPFVCEAPIPLCILRAHYASAFGTLSHRDVLGALMHLGIERDKIGDIVIKDRMVYIIIDEEIENYIVCNLTRIKRNSMHFERCEEELHHEAEIIYKDHIVSSLRLDVLVASFAGVSRAQAAKMITSGDVKVDHVVLEQTSYLCNNNSAISIRGYGRYHFAQIKRKTKKDHLVIRAGVYV